MPNNRETGEGHQSARLLALAFLAAMTSSCSHPSDDSELQALKDRTAVGDLITEVYANVEAASLQSYNDYYTSDAHFEVNGTSYKGREEIIDYHRNVAETSPVLEGTFHMLVNNMAVKVTGDTATAKLIFTGVLSRNVTGPPELHKHGREYNLLKRQADGKWRITRRVIVSDASAESDFAGILRPGPDFDILAQK